MLTIVWIPAFAGMTAGGLERWSGGAAAGLAILEAAGIGCRVELPCDLAF
jgi:hypothetical protein